MLKDLVRRNRSYRRFKQNHLVEEETLRDLIDHARLSASAANLQPLKYIISNSQEKNARIFETLAWAGYLTDWDGPTEGERPASYIVVLGDREISKKFAVDAGIAAQTILLAASEKGLGGCIFASVQRDKLRQSLEIPERYEIILVIAIGKPAEKVEIEEVKDGNIKYWRDEQGIHHVPKRSLKDLIL